MESILLPYVHGTAGSCLFSFELDARVLPIHHLALMGQPYSAAFNHMSETDLKSLSGEAFSAPCAALLTAAFVLNPWAPWWAPLVGSDNFD